MPKAEQPSLYDRLGGVYSIATVVDDFTNRIMIDPRLNSNPMVDVAHHRVPPAGFKYLVTEMVCWATGGPQKYTGKSMAESHKDLKITSKEWEAFLDDFQQTLDKFAVPTEGQTELKTYRQQHTIGYCCRLTNARIHATRDSLPFERAFKIGDVEAILALHEPGAVLVAGGKPVTGHDRIREALNVFLSAGARMKLDTRAVIESGEGLAVVHGA